MNKVHFAAWISTIVLFAAPGSASADYTDAMTTFPVAESSRVDNTAECPGGGDIAISGGTYNGAPYNEKLWLNSSRPGSLASPGDAGAWTVRIHNFFDGITTTSDSETWVVCDIDGAGDYKIRKEKDVKLKVPKQAEALVKCKGDEAVVGGGAQMNTPGELAFLVSSGPIDDGDTDRRPDGWYVATDTASIDSGGARMDVYAVCDKVRKPKDYRYTTETASAPDGEQALTGAGCDVFEPRVGGGVIVDAKSKHALRINSTQPSNGTNGWEGIIDNDDTPDNEARDFEVTVICLKEE